MDKTSMLLGWLAGMRIAGQRASKEEEQTPIAYLTFASAEPFTIGVNNATKNWDGTLYYSTDTATWNEWDGATAIASAEHGGEQKIYMRGSGNSALSEYSYKTASYAPECNWVLTGSDIRCVGNIENLLDYETVANGEHPVMDAHCFECLFYGCGALITAPELPATTLSNDCYAAMFYGCDGLTTPPELPATIMKDSCYDSMFRESGLITAPSLPATTLAERCYYRMFSDCESLVTIPSLPATELPKECYMRMFYGCNGVKASTTQSDEYPNEYRIPTTGTGTATGVASTNVMFHYTGGTFTGTPSLNATYYTSNEVV